MKKINIGSFKYTKLKRGYQYNNNIYCSYAILDIIEEKKLSGVEFDVFLIPKKEEK